MDRDKLGGGDASAGNLELDEAWKWPVGIALALCFIVAVNIAFIAIAVSGADPVVSTYVDARR